MTEFFFLQTFNNISMINGGDSGVACGGGGVEGCGCCGEGGGVKRGGGGEFTLTPQEALAQAQYDLSA